MTTEGSEFRYVSLILMAYYDGPEKGLLVGEAGRVLRFEMLAESRRRMFKAHALALVSPGWLPQIALAFAGRDATPSTRPADALTVLEELMFAAPASQLFVGVCCLSLEHLRMCATQASEIERLQLMRSEREVFCAASRVSRGPRAIHVREMRRGG